MLRWIAVAITAATLAAAADVKLQPVTEAGYSKVLAANKGKVVLVNFWATYCVPCRAEMPALVKLEARLKAKGFTLVTVSADEPEQEAAAAKFIAQNSVPAPAYIRKAADDEKFINLVDAKWSGALPASILYDKTGKRIKSFYGETKIADLEAAISKLL